MEYLDGHRGVAVLLVMLFHAYSRWPELVPYGGQYADFPIFKFGWMGVELFFVISGFVILMTLEKCVSVRQFLYRRWLRLFPSMLICSAIVFATSGFFFERPAGTPTQEGLIPGLTFTDPKWWEYALGHHIEPLEGSFWTLYVEVKFYILSAIIYYWRGRNVLLGALIVAFIVSVASRYAPRYFGGDIRPLIATTSDQLSFRYFGWFASGAIFYVYTQSKSYPSLVWLFLACTGLITSSVFISQVRWQPVVAANLISLLFAASIVSSKVQRLLDQRALQFFGLISYSLYLIHENLLIASIIKIHRHIPEFPPALLPVLLIALLSFCAFLLTRYAEPPVRRTIELIFERVLRISYR